MSEGYLAFSTATGLTTHRFCSTFRGAVMRVLVADDHRLVIEGVRAALANAEDIELVGTATNGAQVLPLTHRLQPDLVLLDLSMPQMDGLACLQQLRHRFPDVTVVILSGFDDDEKIAAALKAGASGYIIKGIDPWDLASTLRQIVEKSVYHAIGVPDSRDLTPAGRTDLTERELTILQAVARGLSNRQIARELWVTEQTVKFHLTNIYRKLDVNNRTTAAREAFRLGIAQSPAVDLAG